jgi:hypothetical protein
MYRNACNYLKCYSVLCLVDYNADKGDVATRRVYRPAAICLRNDKVRALLSVLWIVQKFFVLSFSLSLSFSSYLPCAHSILLFLIHLVLTLFYVYFLLLQRPRSFQILLRYVSSLFCSFNCTAVLFTVFNNILLYIIIFEH